VTAIVDDIEGALKALGVRIASTDDNEISAFCPHPDHENVKTPAWSMLKTEKVYTRDGRRKSYPPGTFNCFSCGYKGTLDTLVYDVLGLDGFTGARWLRQWGTRDIADIPTYDQLSGPLVLSSLDNLNINENSLIRFVEPNDEQCAKRLFSTETAKVFEILRDSQKNSWILPIRVKGKLIGWQEKAPNFFRNYPAGVRKSYSLFGLGQISEWITEVILVESPLDVARLREAGYPAVSSYGAGVSEHQMKLILARFDSLIIALDNPTIDDAGRKKSEELRKDFGPRIPMWFLNYSETKAKDPGAMTDDELQWAYDNRTHSLA
jgi:hypothetical protein